MTNDEQVSQDVIRSVMRDLAKRKRTITPELRAANAKRSREYWKAKKRSSAQVRTKKVSKTS